MKKDVFFSTNEAAEQLDVHARTVRKWIEAFGDYVRPELNKRGHYQLTEDGLQALRTIHQQLRTGNKSLKQVRAELVQTGKVSPTPLPLPADPSPDPRLNDVITRVTQIETTQQKTLQLLEKVQTTLGEVRAKQDQLKFEIRNATFEQRLQAADPGKTKRKKEGMLRLSQLFR